MISFISCSVNKIRYNWELIGVKGEVKSITEKYFYVTNYSNKMLEIGQKLYGYKYEFDEKGFCNRKVTILNSIKSTSVFIPEYEKGVYIGGSVFSEGALFRKIREKYISSNKVEYTHFDEKGGLEETGSIALEYDEYGLVISELYTTKKENEKSSYSIKYKYEKIDKNGNWLKRLEYLNESKEPNQVAIREYVYYL